MDQRYHQYQERSVPSIEREAGKPNTLMGTGGYFKYASKMTPGFDKGEETNLQQGAKPFKGVNGMDFTNKYKKRSLNLIIWTCYAPQNFLRFTSSRSPIQKTCKSVLIPGIQILKRIVSWVDLVLIREKP